MGRTPIPRVASRPPVPLETWHLIHDLAIEAGCDEVEACRRADERHWPMGEAWPKHLEGLVSPFRDPGKPVTR